MSNTATVSGSLPDPNSSNNSATVDFKVLPNGADLNLTKSKSPDLVPTWPGPGAPPAGSGYIITSTINVNNIGPAPVNSDLQVVDVLGVGEEYLPAPPPPWSCTATPYVTGTQQTVTCTLLSGYPLAAGQSAPPLVLQSFAHPEAEGQPLPIVPAPGVPVARSNPVPMATWAIRTISTIATTAPSTPRRCARTSASPS